MYQAVIVDGIRQQATIAFIQQNFPGLSETAIWNLARQYNLPIWNGTTWQAPPLVAPPALSHGSQAGGLWGTAQVGGTAGQVQQQAGAWPPSSGAPGGAPAVAQPTAIPAVATTASDRLKKAHYPAVARLKAEGRDTSQIAQALNLSPDAVHRALKKIEKDAAAEAAKQQKQPELPNTGPQFVNASATDARRPNDRHGLVPVDPRSLPLATPPGEQMPHQDSFSHTFAQDVPPTATAYVEFGVDADGTTNPVGSYLASVLDKVNSKLERYGLRASFKIEIG
jgi:hypothetical protein